MLYLLYILVDGLWGQWGQWSACTTTCDGGMQQRFRTCKRPLFGGTHCTGDSSQMRKCNVHPCKGTISEPFR